MKKKRVHASLSDVRQVEALPEALPRREVVPLITQRLCEHDGKNTRSLNARVRVALKRSIKDVRPGLVDVAEVADYARRNWKGNFDDLPRKNPTPFHAHLRLPALRASGTSTSLPTTYEECVQALAAALTRVTELESLIAAQRLARAKKARHAASHKRRSRK